MRVVGSLFAVVAAVILTGCSEDSASGPTLNVGGSSGGATITITGSGVSPRNVTIARGAQVTFLNNDSRTHDIRSDSHPGHGDCPEINQVGLIQPGNNRQTGNLTTVRTCGFHDESDASDAAFQGTIQIQ